MSAIWYRFRIPALPTPEASSETIYIFPWLVSKWSKSSTSPGWRKAAIASNLRLCSMATASRSPDVRPRVKESLDALDAGLEIVLSATWRPVSRSIASRTVPSEPAPRTRTTRYRLRLEEPYEYVLARCMSTWLRSGAEPEIGHKGDGHDEGDGDVACSDSSASTASFSPLPARNLAPATARFGAQLFILVRRKDRLTIPLSARSGIKGQTGSDGGSAEAARLILRLRRKFFGTAQRHLEQAR
jgi:hypothetical protein